MSRPIRYQPEEWSVFFVTGRCIHSRFLLRPSQRVNALIIGVLARALERLDVKLFGMCFLSNHYHFLLSSKDAATLASFMQYVGSNIAREVGRQHQWKEKFWSRRYYSSVVLDEAAQEDRMRYILSNSVKEGLVKHVRYWPGVHCYRHLVEGTKLHGIWIDRTAKYICPHLSERDLTTRYTLELSKLPCHEQLSDLQYRAIIRELTNDALADCGVPTKPVGQKRILAMDPHTKPEHPDKSPAPLCHSGCAEKKREFKEAFQEFVSAYKAAYQRVLKHSLRLEFPDGALPPTAWCVSLTPG